MDDNKAEGRTDRSVEAGERRPAGVVIGFKDRTPRVAGDPFAPAPTESDREERLSGDAVDAPGDAAAAGHGAGAGSTDITVTQRKLQRVAKRKRLSLQTVKGLRPLSEATKYVGRQKFLEAILLAVQSNDPIAITFWNEWEKLSEYDKRGVVLDEVALLAGVYAHDLMASAVRAATMLGASTSQMIYASMQPSVVRQMMKSAMRIGGKYAQTAMLDRHKILQHGLEPFLPAPHGQTINVNASSQAAAKAAAAAQSNADPSVPSFLEDMGELDAPKVAVQRHLEATTTRVVDADGDV